MNSLAHIDLLDLDRWVAEGPPFDWFAQLRAEAPVWRHPSPDEGPAFWVVSRHADVVALGRCPQALSSDARYGGITGLGPGDELDEVLESASEVLDEGGSPSDAKMLLSMDPPEHTAHRRMLSHSFTPGRSGPLSRQFEFVLWTFLTGTPMRNPSISRPRWRCHFRCK